MNLAEVMHGLLAAGLVWLSWRCFEHRLDLMCLTATVRRLRRENQAYARTIVREILRGRR